jgi:hypothetical protein
MTSTILTVVLSLALIGGQPEPRITGVAPADLAVSSRPQVLAITGENFRTDLQLLVTAPGGTVRTVTGPEIASPRTTSFQVSLTLDTAGTYALVVLNGDGRKSEPFRLAVKGVARPAQPWIDEIAPETAGKSTEVQVVTLSGRNFAPGLKISITDPAGTVTVADAIDKVTLQAVVFRIALDMSGRYEVMVTNPSGESSNTMGISVR